MNRRELLLNAFPAFAAFGSLSAFMTDNELTDEELLAELGLLRELDNDAYRWVWSILAGITDEELDWKINEEANTIRWIVGHLTWFEEWACDAIEEKGLYMIDEQPANSFQSDDFSVMKERLIQANEKYQRLSENLGPAEIRRDAEYLYNANDKKRAQVDLRTILAIHSTHFYGHLYQIRMVRGTYSRVNNTDKAKFDKW